MEIENCFYMNIHIPSHCYKNYAIAMGKNNCRPISYGRFMNHIESYCVGIQYGDSFIFGKMMNESFVVSHWSPNGTREGLKMLKKLLDSNISVIFAVQPKMADMLTRIGYVYQGEIDVTYPKPQTKVVVGTDIPQPWSVDSSPSHWEELANEMGWNEY